MRNLFSQEMLQMLQTRREEASEEIRLEST